VADDIMADLPELGPATCHTCSEWGCRDDKGAHDGRCSCTCHFWQWWVEDAQAEIKRLEDAKVIRDLKIGERDRSIEAQQAEIARLRENNEYLHDVIASLRGEVRELEAALPDPPPQHSPVGSKPLTVQPPKEARRD